MNGSGSDLWHRISHDLVGNGQPGWLPLVTGLIALGCVLPASVWPLTRNVVTIAHEGGHALVAVLVGRRLDGVRLHSDTSGVTFSRGRPTGPGVVLTAAAGYITPSLLGLAAAAVIAMRHPTAVLWAAVAFLAALLLWIRNGYGAILVVLVGGGVFAVSEYTSPHVQAVAAYVFTWFLLLGGVRPIFELQRKRYRRGASSSDADQLAQLTGVPGLAWVMLFCLVAFGSLLVGAHLLTGLPDLGH